MIDTSIFKNFIISCGNQYISDYVLDDNQIIAIDNYIDYVIDKLEDVEKLEEIVKGKSNEKSN